MNEERKPKKLNIKKIGIVALSVIMIMATFCLSAFADNPLTKGTKTITTEVSISGFGGEDGLQWTWFSWTWGQPIYTNIDIIINNQEYTNVKRIDQRMISDGSYQLWIWYTEETNTYEVINYETNKYTIKAEDIIIDKIIEQTNYFFKKVFAPALPNETYNISIEQIDNNSILGTFLGVGTWIGGAVSALIGIFYLNGSLTFIGYLAVAALAVSVVFLLIYLISSFLKFRG